MLKLVIANGEGGVGMPTTADALLAGKRALDAIEAGIRVVEADPSVRSVGFGGHPNALGEMECDASVMCGATLRAGAVGAVKNRLYVFSLARQVMERLPHVMLVGEGAARFAAEIGETTPCPLSDKTRTDYERWQHDRVPEESRARWPDVPLAPVVWPPGKGPMTTGTTCFVARAADGDWAGGISTSGWAYKYPGRLGDSPIIGAGLYVDSRFGAAACTHVGEMVIRAGTSRAIVAYMKKGASVVEACQEALDDLRALKGGFLGPVIIHAADRDGNHCVTSLRLGRPPPYWYWCEGMEMPERRTGVDC